MKWYFAAPTKTHTDFLIDEKVKHILLFHAFFKKRIPEAVEKAIKAKRVELMVDSGGFSYSVRGEKALLQPYLDFLLEHKALISECIVLDDTKKREVTFKNYAKMKAVGVPVLTIDHLWFKWGSVLDTAYRDHDKLCWGGMAFGTRMQSERHKDQIKGTMNWKEGLLPKVRIRHQKALMKPFTGVHLLGVGQQLKRYMPFFDIVDSFDTASWTVAPGAYGKWPMFYDVGKINDNKMPMLRFYSPPWKGPRPPKEVYEMAERGGLDLYKWQDRLRAGIREFQRFWGALEKMYEREKSKGLEHLVETAMQKDIEGPYEPLYVVYPVAWQSKQERMQEADQASTDDKLTVGEFFYQPKPTRPALAEQLQSVGTLMSLYKEHAEKWLPTFVQKKYDGANHQAHKSGDKVVIISEEGEDNTDRLPGMVEELKALKADKLIVPLEIEAWDGSRHLPREAVAGYLHSSGEPDDSNIVGNIYDVIYLDEDIHKKETSDRLDRLKALGVKQSTMGVPDLRYRLNAAPGIKADDLEELERAVERIRRLPGSEGIVAKQVDSPYPLKRVTPDSWIKYHNATTIRGVVYGSEKTKSGVWVYQYGVLPGKEKPKATAKADSKEIVPVGDTFMTSRRFSEGDNILVEAETVNLTQHSDGQEITAWVPRVIGEYTGKPDTVDAAADRARKEMVLSLKEVDEDGETKYLPVRKVEKQQDPYMEVPPEGKPYRYSVQHHFRGKGFHADLRMAFKPKSLLIGWTMNTQIAGSVKEPVVTLAQAKALSRDMDKISKVNWNTGEWASRPKAGTDKLVRTEILSERKAPEPYAWIDVEGKTKDPEPGKAPPVGGTRQYPGVFVIVDQGTVEYGAQKPWFHEYFFRGKGLNYRMFFRLLRIQKSESGGECQACGEAQVTKSLGWEDDPEPWGLCDGCAREFLTKQGVVLPPSEEQSLGDSASWLAIYPDDQMPYVLDKDAASKGWMPPSGYSALPEAISKQIPNEYRYWTKRGAAAKQLRDELVQKMADGEVKIDPAAPYKNAAKATMLDADFVLQEQSWRGPVQVRVGPTRTRWWVRIDVGRSELLVIDLARSPLDNKEVTAQVGHDSHKESLRLTGDIKPGHYLNPTKETPSVIEALDSGKAEVMELTDDLVKVRFKGKKLKGLYTIKRNNSEHLWSPAQVAPEAKTDVEKQVDFEMLIPIHRIEVKKADGKEKRLVTGIVLEPDVVDAQGDYISPEAIERAAHAFLKEYNKGTEMGLMHKVFGDIGIELVESSIAPMAYTLDSKAVKKGSWVVTVHVASDKRWKDVKDGKLTGFSVGGVATVKG